MIKKKSTDSFVMTETKKRSPLYQRRALREQRMLFAVFELRHGLELILGRIENSMIRIISVSGIC
jgi:hypothetical protein